MTRAKDISKILTDADLSGTLDVTGTVTAGGLDIQGDGTISGGSRLTISDIADENNDGIRLDDSTTARFNNLTQDSSGNFKIQHWTGSAWQNNFTVTTGGNVGIGTSSPVSTMHLEGDTPVVTLRDTSAYSAGTGSYIQFQGKDSGGTNVNFGQIHGLSLTSNNGVLAFYTRSGGTTAERVRITDVGRVGIGTSIPETALHVRDTSAIMRLVSDTNSTSGVDFGDTADTNIGRLLYDHTDNSMRFTTNTSERMRIDSSGNLLVGKTSSSGATVGSELRPAGNNIFTRNAGQALTLRRNNSNGDIIHFNKDGTTVGSIGTSSSGSDFFKVIGSQNYFDTGVGNTGLRFYEGLSVIYPLNTDTDSGRDNAIDLGLASVRFDDIFATNGTIQTSDRNEKQDIEELSDAEQRVAIVAKGLMRKFRWKDSVAEKGDNARTHFGIIAQDLQDAFTAEGLDAGDYAMFTSNTWTDDDGNEQTRLGVRYNQLLAFIISAI